jgi:hypothetical protein
MANPNLETVLDVDRLCVQRVTGAIFGAIIGWRAQLAS